VARDGTALCYRVLVTALKGTFTFDHLQNQFAVCNSTKQVTAGWKAQLRHAGVKLRDLPPYGRRPRFALTAGSYVKDIAALAPEAIFTISKIHLVPELSPGGLSSFFTYTATDGNTITYRAPAAAVPGTVCANQITQVTITDGAGAETNVPLVMSGTGVASEFGVIEEYLKGRRQSPDVSIDTPGPEADAAMLNLFSVSEEMSDDIISGVEEYMDWKPYTPDWESNNYDELTEGAMISSVTSAVSQYPLVSAVMDVPLGLLRVITQATNDHFRLDVLAIYEM